MHEQTITPFLFEGTALVRVILRDGAPWFVAKDVCDVLGIAWKRSDTLAGLDPDEKGAGITGSLGGDQEALIVSESGLYALVFRSRKAKAKEFRRWVTGEVLPAIRKTGSYGAAAPAREGEVIPPGSDGRRFPEWTAEDMRSRRGIVDMYRMTFGGAAAQWIMPQLGFPVPPPQLIERGRQIPFSFIDPNGGA